MHTLANTHMDVSVLVTVVLPAISTIVAAVATAWAVSKTSALQAWRDAALGYKEQVADLTGRLSRAESSIVEANKKITELQLKPDMTAVIEVIREESEATRKALGR